MLIGCVAWLAMPALSRSFRHNRKRIIRRDKQGFRARHLIENAFRSLKDFGRVATRYGKLAANFRSNVALATALAFWL